MKTLIALLAVAVLATPALAAKGKKPTPKGAVKTTPATTPLKPEGSAPDPRASAPADVNNDAPIDTGTRKGPARMEFDDRLVQGQTNKANAIYLFERRESALRSLLKKRTDFHDQIDEMLEDELVK